MTLPVSVLRRLGWLILFGAAFAFVESSVVVYLRAIYSPSGFSFPLKPLGNEHLTVELAREIATIVILGVVAVLAGARRWERVGYFLAVFGVWDIFYYIWLKVVLDWPATVFDWDVLFLLPLPWIGPVVAPVLISLAMFSCGVTLCFRLERGHHFRPGLLSWTLAVLGSALILYSFMADTGASLSGLEPRPYKYELLFAGLSLLGLAFARACARRAGEAASP